MGLNCDLYHLSMCQSLLREGTHERHTVYEMFVRKVPLGYSYMVFAGLGTFLEWVDSWEENVARFLSERDSGVSPLANSGLSALDSDFLDFLSHSTLDITINALREGEIFFPNTPLVQISGPHWACVVVEAALLNFVNTQTAVATIASRIVGSADGRPVIEFGLRRSMDVGGMLSSRGASIGGVTGTSNVCASLRYNLPVMGTHAHSFVMSYGDGGELDAFCSYMRHCGLGSATLLIDTYDTIEGAKNAMLASKLTGVLLSSVRIDSGDLAYLSMEVRKVLDLGGFSSTKIIVSGDLDEFVIHSLLGEQSAPIDAFGVGTSLVVGKGLAPLGGVYKLRSIDGVGVQKISSDPFKTTLPGATALLRMFRPDSDGGSRVMGDVILPMDMLDGVVGEGAIVVGAVGLRLLRDVRSVDEYTSRVRTFPVGTGCSVLYAPCRRHVGTGCYSSGGDYSVESARSLLQKSLQSLDISYRRLVNPHRYVVGIEESLYRLKKTQ